MQAAIKAVKKKMNIFFFNIECLKITYAQKVNQTIHIFKSKNVKREKTVSALSAYRV